MLNPLTIFKALSVLKNALSPEFRGAVLNAAAEQASKTKNTWDDLAVQLLKDIFA